MKRRHPRRDLERRRRARARVSLVATPQGDTNPDGSVTSKQVADVTLPREELDRIWTPEYLERLARTYWRFLTRISLGLLRVVYSPAAREIVVLARPLRLLTFHAPEYETTARRGSVTWRIKQGLLVAPRGRGKGFLRIAVERGLDADGPEASVRVSSEVANFYPLIAGWGWFSRIGRVLYRVTQLRIHAIVTNAFLRSLARLDLSPSMVGALRRREDPEDPAAAAAGELEPAGR
ncbi:MAG TPA: hypothetical protein VF520_09425 [Thermoleophilaceae bacterium]